MQHTRIEIRTMTEKNAADLTDEQLVLSGKDDRVIEAEFEEQPVDSKDDQDKKTSRFTFDMKCLVEFDKNPIQAATIVTSLMYLLVVGLFGNIALGLAVYVFSMILAIGTFITIGRQKGSGVNGVISLFKSGGENLTTAQKMKIKAANVGSLLINWGFMILVLLGTVLQFVTR